MKVSKLFICFLLFVSTSSFAQEKKLHFGIGMNGTISKFNYSTPFSNNPLITCTYTNTFVFELFDSANFNFSGKMSSINPFLEFENGRFLHRVGLSLSPFNNFNLEKSIYYYRNDVFSIVSSSNDTTGGLADFDYFIYGKKNNKFMVGIMLSNEFKLFKNFFGIVNSQIIFNDNKISFGSVVIPFSTGLSYHLKENCSLFLSAGNNFSLRKYAFTDFNTREYGSFSGVPSKLSLNNARSVTLGLNFSFQSNGKNDLSPTKTIQF